MRKCYFPFGWAVVVAFGLGIWFIVYFLVEWDPSGRPVRLLLTDDAMISMDYARSWAQGCGWVWYCGADRVEGFTNPLWVAYMAFWHLFPFPPAVAALPIVLTGFLTLYLQLRYTYKLAKRYFSEEVGRLAVWLLALLPPAVLWHFMGLETGFLMALTTYLSYEASMREAPTFPNWIGCAAGILTRMDFLVPLGALCIFWSLRTRRRYPFLLILGTCIGLLVVLTVVRWSYYGALLPNTYYLKVTSVPLFLRWANGLLTLGGSLLTNLPLWALGVYAVIRGWEGQGIYWLAILVVGAEILYSVYVGGDAWEMAALTNRYLGLGYPLLGVLAASVLKRYKLLFQMVGLAFISAGVSNRWLHLSTLAPYVRPLSKETVSNLFSVFVPFPLPDLGIESGAKVWLGPAGTTPYFYPQYRYGDYLGKCDSAVAHRSPTCYLTMRFYQLYTPGHTRIGIDRVLADEEAKVVCIGPRGHPGRVRSACEAERYLPRLEEQFTYRPPYGWFRR
ncbi:MAG: glycosyltransferase family 39 protein [Bacteroidia bacterium]|nr:glycosyltransferase family 39 protein [Bacteroidia bacterium]